MKRLEIKKRVRKKWKTRKMKMNHINRENQRRRRSKKFIIERKLLKIWEIMKRKENTRRLKNKKEKLQKTMKRKRKSIRKLRKKSMWKRTKKWLKNMKKKTNTTKRRKMIGIIEMNRRRKEITITCITQSASLKNNWKKKKKSHINIMIDIGKKSP